MDQCLFHTARLKFDKMTRDVQLAKIIPKKFAPRLAMAVCSCRKNKMNVKALMTEKELHNKITELKERLSIETTWPDSLLDYLYKVLSDDITLIEDSQCRFIYVIHQAIFHINFDMLTRASVSSNPEKDEKPVKVNKKPLPQNIIDLIIKKKMKKAKFQRRLSLSMFPGNLKTLLSSPDYVKLVVESKPNVIIIFNHSQNTTNMKNNKNQTEAMIAGENEKAIKEFCEALKLLAAKQQKVMDTRHQEIKEMRKRRKQRSWNTYGWRYYEDEYDVDVANVKEDMVANYSFTRKKFWQKKSQASAQKTANQSVLVGGHCLSCLKPFDGLKSETRKDSCRYHLGYIYFNYENNTDRWTCCDEESLDDKPTAEDHSQNGCCTSNHVWRPHKKANRKPGVNHKEESDGDMAKKLVNQNSVKMSAKDVLSVYHSWFN